MDERFYFQINENSHKKRLDEFLFDEFQTLSKIYLRECLKQEKCEVNGENVKSSYVLKANDFVEIEVDLEKKTSMQPEPIPLEIAFEDDEIIVVNKPAGMLVHPTHKQKNGTLLNALVYYLNNNSRAGAEGKTKSKNQKSGIVRPGLIHRLDQQTSGLIVIAKTARAHRILSNHFQKKLVEKKYLALVEGVVKDEFGTINAPIGRDAELKRWKVQVDGKDSETRFWVKQRFSDATLLELEPVTGRTNQLRIHCAHIGHPIAGDQWHGGRKFERLCLHAYKISFWHPNGKGRLEFETKAENLFETMCKS